LNKKSCCIRPFFPPGDFPPRPSAGILTIVYEHRMVSTLDIEAAILGNDAECRSRSAHMSLDEHEYVSGQRGLLHKFHPFESTGDVQNFYIAFVIAFHSILIVLFAIEICILVFSLIKMSDPVRSLHRWNISRWHWNIVHEAWAGGISSYSLIHHYIGVLAECKSHFAHQ
jgi:hypothetical protein